MGPHSVVAIAEAGASRALRAGVCVEHQGRQRPALAAGVWAEARPTPFIWQIPALLLFYPSTGLFLHVHLLASLPRHLASVEETSLLWSPLSLRSSRPHTVSSPRGLVSPVNGAPDPIPVFGLVLLAKGTSSPGDRWGAVGELAFHSLQIQGIIYSSRQTEKTLNVCAHCQLQSGKQNKPARSQQNTFEVVEGGLLEACAFN